MRQCCQHCRACRVLEPPQKQAGQWAALTMDILVYVGCSPVWEYLVVPVLVLSSIIRWIAIPVMTENAHSLVECGRMCGLCNQ
jgi:hypothetical protein